MVASTSSDPGDLGPDNENDATFLEPGTIEPTRTLTPLPHTPQTPALPEVAQGSSQSQSQNTPHTPLPDALHGMMTQRLPRKKSQTDSHHTKYSDTTSPAQAMRLEEIARTQIFLKVAIITSIAGVIAAFFTGGDAVAFNVDRKSVV